MPHTAAATPITGPFSDHALGTYFFLRSGMALLAAVFPLLLWGMGAVLVDLPLQTSMSAYYHSVVRDAFVGVMFVIGFYLLLYKGFGRAEDWTLNAAGLLAIGVALFPMNPAADLFCCKPLCGPECMAFTDQLDRTHQPFIDAKLAGFGVHGLCAGLFFVAIFFVCAVFSRKTVNTIENDTERRFFLWTYSVLGAAMLVVPALLVGMREFGLFGVDLCRDTVGFWIESALVEVFAAFWAVKTIEMTRNDTDLRFPARRGPMPPAPAARAA